MNGFAELRANSKLSTFFDTPCRKQTLPTPHPKPVTQTLQHFILKPGVKCSINKRYIVMGAVFRLFIVLSFSIYVVGLALGNFR